MNENNSPDNQQAEPTPGQNEALTPASSAQPPAPTPEVSPGFSAAPAPETTPITDKPATDKPIIDKPTSSSNEPHKKLPMTKILIVALVLLLPIASLIGYNMSNKKAKKTQDSLNSQLALINSNEHTLPAGSVKVSECIPNMGFHYMPKTADPSYGPFFLVSKKNKVIGVEYMVSKDMYTPIPQTDPPVEVVIKGSPLYGWKYDHAEIDHLPKGHEGLLVDHVDIHMYTVTTSQQQQACI